MALIADIGHVICIGDEVTGLADELSMTVLIAVIGRSSKSYAALKDFSDRYFADIFMNVNLVESLFL